ncbi:hypothetical protein C4D60_Mb06t34360 [Musa balbisiana]|uniref:Uncharacterized protein n=1 Tax=Musa balbisiana TaxID=52838 RepID=A0A4S8ISS6_MUSBA|nr:hypothetical protein C4D60_Mb06t34360 [Musa balbisiana]
MLLPNYCLAGSSDSDLAIADSEHVVLACLDLQEIVESVDVACNYSPSQACQQQPVFDVLSEPEIEAYSAEPADEEENDVAYMVEPEDAIAAVMRASPAGSAGQNLNGHVIAEEANPAEEAFVWVALVAVGLALGYEAAVGEGTVDDDVAAEAVEVQTGLAIEQDDEPVVEHVDEAAVGEGTVDDDVAAEAVDIEVPGPAAVVASEDKTVGFDVVGVADQIAGLLFELGFVDALACKAAEQVYEAVVSAFAQDGHWVEIGAGAKVAAAVAVELPVIVAVAVAVAGAGLEAGPGLEAEAELGDEVETAHMKKSAAVLELLAEGQLASEIGHTVGRVAAEIEHSVDIAADKGHSHGTSDSTAGIAIVVAAK